MRPLISLVVLHNSPIQRNSLPSNQTHFETRNSRSAVTPLPLHMKRPPAFGGPAQCGSRMLVAGYKICLSLPQNLSHRNSLSRLISQFPNSCEIVLTLSRPRCQYSLGNGECSVPHWPLPRNLPDQLLLPLSRGPSKAAVPVYASNVDSSYLSEGSLYYISPCCSRMSLIASSDCISACTLSILSCSVRICCLRHLSRFPNRVHTWETRVYRL
jgi:hypothetical protein